MEFESAGARKQVIISCFYFCSSQIALISRQLADRRQQADDDLSQDLGVDGPSLSSLAPLPVSDPVSQCLSVSEFWRELSWYPGSAGAGVGH